MTARKIKPVQGKYKLNSRDKRTIQNIRKSNWHLELQRYFWLVIFGICFFGSGIIVKNYPVNGINYPALGLFFIALFSLTIIVIKGFKKY
jgi:hypothetical protein